MVAEECWLREGSKSQLFRVRDIGVIVHKKTRGRVFGIAHSCGSFSLLAAQIGFWVRQVHPGKWKQASCHSNTQVGHIPFDNLQKTKRFAQMKMKNVTVIDCY